MGVKVTYGKHTNLKNANPTEKSVGLSIFTVKPSKMPEKVKNDHGKKEKHKNILKNDSDKDNYDKICY